MKKMDVITETSLEALLQRATDCRNKNTDTAAIDAFCGIIKKEADGPAIATRLIANKIQSPEEWEALQGLAVLETCMKNCGSAFHSEIGKFRFLNEMIKLVSPKFLGPRTAESVREQVLKIMRDWTLHYPKQPKIKEAYEMLIKQGVVPKMGGVSFIGDSKSSVTQEHKTNALFQDEEKVRLLEKLLHSKNPEDLQAANRLIKTMVREDEKRVELKSKRISEIETVRNNVRLLSEMLNSYKPDQSSCEELELIKELYQGCGRLKPNIYRIASETQDNDEFLSQVLSVDDELDHVLKKYKDIILDKNLNNILSFGGDSKQVSALLDLSTPTSELLHIETEKDINQLDLLSEPIVNSVLDLEGPFNTSVLPLVTSEATSTKTIALLDSSDNAFPSSSPQNYSKNIMTLNNLSTNMGNDRKNNEVRSNKLNALDELDVLSETLLQQCKLNAQSKKLLHEEDCDNKKETENVDVNLKAGTQMLQKLNSAAALDDDDENVLMSLIDQETCLNVTKPLVEPNLSSNKEVKPLIDVSVSLESIKPSSIPSINVIKQKNGISVTIHVAQDTPREDVTVYVITSVSSNSSPINNYLFQAVVSKGCKLKLQPPSGTELPVYNPFLPPMAITQIMLIANPNKVDVDLKCIVSYTVDDETLTEMGEVEKLPSLL